MTYDKENRKNKTKEKDIYSVLSVADPGFGQGGGQEFFPRFCRHSEVKSDEQSEQYNISI